MAKQPKARVKSGAQVVADLVAQQRKEIEDSRKRTGDMVAKIRALGITVGMDGSGR